MNRKTRRILYSTLGSAFVLTAAYTAFNNQGIAANNKYTGTSSYKEYMQEENINTTRRDMASYIKIESPIDEEQTIEAPVPTPNPIEASPAPTPKPTAAPSAASSTKAAPKTAKVTSTNTSPLSTGQAPKQSPSSSASAAVTVVSNGKSYSVTAEEKKLLARLVNAEAGGESYEGKLAVATVVINRVTSSTFPNSVTQVIMGQESGRYQFSPVSDGRINNPPSADSVRAVDQVLGGYRSFSSNVMWFLNPQKSTSGWIINNRTYYKSIGNHDFYY